MNHKKAKRKADDVRRKDMKHMAEDAPDSNAVKGFRRPVAYQAGKLLQEQGEQMESIINIKEGVCDNAKCKADE